MFQYELLNLLFNVINCITYSFDLFSRIIRNFNFKFFFERHDQFYDIQRIRTQIINKSGVAANLNKKIEYLVKIFDFLYFYNNRSP